MLHKRMYRLALLGGALLTGAGAYAQQDNSRIILDALVQKGVLTAGEAQAVMDQVAKSPTGLDVITNPSDKFLKKLTFTGRFQVQFADIGASIDGTTVNPVSTEHFLLRRIYLGARADFTNNLYGAVTYDFANASFDAAYVGWKQSDLLSLEAGLKKAPFDYEEVTSSGALKAIERSTVTRYFDESNNGRRLGAAGYRIGLFAYGTQDMFFYSVAVTNPERNEYSGDGTTGAGVSVNGTLSGVQSGSNAATNSLAYYGMAGVADKFSLGTYRIGVEGGYVPDQGGPGSAIGQGNKISMWGVYTDEVLGDLELQGEYLEATDQHGFSTTRDAKPKGYWLQPSYYVIPKVLEAVVRYSYVDSDHRGVALSDGIRLSPSGGTMDKLNEWYIGGNWYIDGNDAKLQFGYIHGETKNSTALVAPATQPHAQADGVRTQMQINF